MNESPKLNGSNMEMMIMNTVLFDQEKKLFIKTKGIKYLVHKSRVALVDI